MILAVSGYKNSGKSTLCRELLRLLKDRGFKVGYIKHTHESVASPSASDTGRAVGMGVDALLLGDDSFKYEHVETNIKSMDVRALAGRFFPDSDVVVLEGGKELPLPKVWVLGEGESVPAYPGIFAVYNRFSLGNDREVYGCGEQERLVSDICAKIHKKRTRVYIGASELSLKEFIANFISNSITGMLESLKNVPERGYRGDIRIYLKNDMDER